MRAKNKNWRTKNWNANDIVFAFFCHPFIDISAISLKKPDDGKRFLNNLLNRVAYWNEID